MYRSNFDIISQSNSVITITSGSVKDIYEGIMEFYEMTKDKRKEYGERGYDYLMKNHTFSTIAERYYQFLESL